jgi:DNA-binding CsgD family transcriptional regulator
MGMPNPNFRRWTPDDISILKKLAQTHPMALIAAQLGRSPSAIALKAHEMKLTLKMHHSNIQELIFPCVDPGPAGFDWRE